MSDNLKYDFAIIGAGSGGLTFAAVASQLGHKVALIEKGKMGGDCLNYGCVPSKALLAAAKKIKSAKEAEKYGVKSSGKVDFKKVKEHIQSTINTIAPHDSQERFESLGADVFREHASFINHNTLKVGNQKIEAKKIIISTGSSPAVPPIKGIEESGYLTNETIFDLEELPEHLAIIGGGPIGCEMAQAFSNLGSQVTLLETAPSILSKDNSEAAQTIHKHLSKGGANIINNANIINILQNKIKLKSEEIKFSHILIAAGRKPNIYNLNLEAAGIEFSNTGIHTNNKMQTTNKHVYAIGDCTGKHPFTHMAGAQASIVIQRLLFGNMLASQNENAVPWVTYTDIELAHVGMNKEQAKSKYGVDNIKVTTRDFDKNDRAQAEGNTEGFISIITKKNGQVLGADIVGQNAGEIINQWTPLIHNKAKIKEVLKSIYPYPTLSESNKHLASGYYEKIFYSKTTQKISQWLFRYIGVHL